MEPSPEVPGGDNGQGIVVVRIYFTDREKLKAIGHKTETYPEILRTVIGRYLEGEDQADPGPAGDAHVG